MAQFDVHRNRASSATEFPYLINVQGREFERTPARLVIPLAKEIKGYPSHVPQFNLEDRSVAAIALLMFSIPVRQLGPVIASLADDDSAARLIAAIDRAISRA